MKELSIEEKAKAYDKAIEIINDYYQKIKYSNLSCTSNNIEVLERAFPQLKESKDEQHRNWILEYLYDGLRKSDEQFKDQYKSAIAWLEKQGEPNPYSGVSFKYKGHTFGMCARDNGVEILFDGELKAFVSSEKSFVYPIHPQPDLAPKNAMEVIKEENIDNVNKLEPKFKVGDWVVCEVTGLVYQIRNCIENFSNHKYGYDLTNDGYIGSNEVNHYHLWTIQDAKDGDVLQLGEVTAIFQGYIGNRNCKCYCSVYDGEFEIPSQDDDNSYGCYNTTPATQEQSDLLFQKMKEAGYEWNAEKKELKKVEPKFKVGDWVVRKDLGKYKIVEVCESWYEVISYNDGIQYTIGFDRENDYHLWTIQDAKDGDVLVASDDSIFIFAGMADCACKYYVALTNFNEVKINKKAEGGYWETSRAVHPATQEQCDILFQKMREEGYEWNAESRKLKKIEQKTTDEEMKTILQTEYEKGRADAIAEIHRSAWSEEDEEMCYKATAVINRLCAEGEEYVWSIGTLNKLFYWLKSLRPQNTWKPSDEQMEALEHFIVYHNGSTNYAKDLEELRLQLKKLNDE